MPATAMPAPVPIITPLTAMSSGDREALIALFQACVDGGASMGYLAPMPLTEAEAYWRRIESDLAVSSRVLHVARDESGRIIGSVQLALELRPNGRHRAEVQKLIVLPSRRRRGLGSRLMAELEATARGRGLRLLYLDTSEGPGGAQALYESLGYAYAGGIPDYALDPDRTPRKNAIYYKTLAPAG